MTAPIADHMVHNGVGIEEVRFKMFSPKQFQWYDANEANAPYCLFGETSSVCDPMDATRFRMFVDVPGTYTIQVRVKTTANARWTGWQEYDTTVVAPNLACDGTTDALIGQLSGAWSAWAATDIGNASTGTTRILPTGEMLVCGSGDDIWDGNDSFRYVYRSIPAGFSQLTARVVFFDGSTHASSKAGLMLRSSTGANAANGFVALTRDSGVRMQWRENNNDGTTNKDTIGSPTTPLLLRLTRVSATEVQTAYSADDGATWQTSGTHTVNDLHNFSAIGFAVTSHNNGSFAKIVVTDLVFE
jgi:hypothetical protein